MRSTRFVFIASALLIAVLSTRVWANHFSVTLEVSDGTNKQAANTETEPPKAREVVVRPVMQSTVGAKCVAKFKQ